MALCWDMDPPANQREIQHSKLEQAEGSDEPSALHNRSRSSGPPHSVDASTSDVLWSWCKRGSYSTWRTHRSRSWPSRLLCKRLSWNNLGVSMDYTQNHSWWIDMFQRPKSRWGRALGRSRAFGDLACPRRLRSQLSFVQKDRGKTFASWYWPIVASLRCLANRWKLLLNWHKGLWRIWSQADTPPRCLHTSNKTSSANNHCRIPWVGLPVFQLASNQEWTICEGCTLSPEWPSRRLRAPLRFYFQPCKGPPGCS